MPFVISTLLSVHYKKSVFVYFLLENVLVLPRLHLVISVPSESLKAMFKINKLEGISFAFGKLLKNFREYSSTNNTIKAQHTALYDFHTKHGGKMVNFGGYILPVQYRDQSIISSHLHTRHHASIFDVSHMLQTYVHGKDAIACIESLCTADIKGMTVGTSSLTMFTNDNGGILDDLIVSKSGEEQLYIVSNAAMKSQDMKIMLGAMVTKKFTLISRNSLKLSYNFNAKCKLKILLNVDNSSLRFFPIFIALLALTFVKYLTLCDRFLIEFT